MYDLKIRLESKSWSTSSRYS